MNIFHHALKQTLFIFSLVFVFSLFPTTDTFASANNNVAGNAWSSNIGWISMNNCTDPANTSTCSGTEYGVTASTTAPGSLSGYAWSSNLGWVTFTPSNDCPSGFSSCSPNIDWSKPNGNGSFNVKGWARVCSVYMSGCSGSLEFSDSTGGWDGWIALGDTNTADTKNWGVTVSATGAMNGFAWGGDVIGWISFSGVAIDMAPDPSGTLTATDCLITAGNKSCDSSYTWTIQNPISGAQTAVIRNDDWTSYSIPLTDLNVGTRTPVKIQHGTTIFYLSHNGSEIALPAEAHARCAPNTILVDSTKTCVAIPTVKLTASSYSIADGQSVLLKWTSTNADSCVSGPSGPSFATGGLTSNSSGVGVSPATTTTYQISCSNIVGTATDSVTIVVDGVVPAPTVNLMPSDMTINPGQIVNLTWTSQNTSSCNGFNFDTRGAKNDLSPGVDVSPFVTTTYSISCAAAVGLGTAFDQVTLTVNAKVPECRDGIDNDGDTKIDYPNDPGCSDANDNSEANNKRKPIFKEF